VAWMGLRWLVLAVALAPSFYYVYVIYAARKLYRRLDAMPRDFTPAVSVLKPVHGLDPEAYENFASFCRQDYPQFEILFAVSSEQDPGAAPIRKLIADFPHLPIHLLVVDRQPGSNDKVNKLCAMARAAQHELLVLSDADTRVGPGYLRSLAAPFRDPNVGAATSLYTGIPMPSLWPEMEAISIGTDFMPAVIVAQQLQGVQFALGATIAVRHECLEEIGGFEALTEEAADDYVLGNRVAARGHRVELVDGSVKTWCCLTRLTDFFTQRLRWAIMARQSRSRGYLGLIFTQGLPWTILAAFVAPTRRVAVGFFVAYVVLRLAVVWRVSWLALRDETAKRQWWIVPFWDVFAFIVWMCSLVWNRVRWRGAVYRVAGGRLIPIDGTGRVAVRARSN
jgi:ceramide glucosyltransferase